jgi:phospholipid transport system substrate-binding protein
VLSRDWAALSDRQKKDFVREFRQHLSAAYGRNLESYRGERVDIRDVRGEPSGDQVVRTWIVRPGAENVSVDYRLREIEGRWRVIDVSIESISLVSNFRSQFRDILANGGIDRLLGLLREKNAAAAKSAATGSGGRVVSVDEH